MFLREGMNVREKRQKRKKEEKDMEESIVFKVSKSVWFVINENERSC